MSAPRDMKTAWTDFNQAVWKKTISDWLDIRSFFRQRTALIKNPWLAFSPIYPTEWKSPFAFSLYAMVLVFLAADVVNRCFDLFELWHPPPPSIIVTETRDQLAKSKMACSELRERKKLLKEGVSGLKQGEKHLTQEVNELIALEKSHSISPDRIKERIALLESESASYSAQLNLASDTIHHFDIATISKAIDTCDGLTKEMEVINGVASETTAWWKSNMRMLVPFMVLCGQYVFQFIVGFRLRHKGLYRKQFARTYWYVASASTFAYLLLASIVTMVTINVMDFFPNTWKETFNPTTWSAPLFLPMSLWATWRIAKLIRKAAEVDHSVLVLRRVPYCIVAANGIVYLSLIFIVAGIFLGYLDIRIWLRK